MMRDLQLSKIIGIIRIVLFGLLISVNTIAANRFSVATGNWSSTSTWSASSKGAPGASVPVAGDAVIIEGGNIVTVDIANAACTSMQPGSNVNGGGDGTLSFNSGSVLTVSGSVQLGNGGNNRGAGSLDMTNGGLLKVGNAFTAPRLGSFTEGTGTIEYTRANTQNVYATAYYNLVLSGTSAKTILVGTSVTRNLSIAPTGSATASISAGQVISVGSLTLGGTNRSCGTWGSTSSAATNKTNTYFAATTGYISVIIPSAPTVSPGSAVAICSGSSTNLNATSSGNTIYWYTVSTGGSNIGSSSSGVNFSVAPISSTTYYAEAQTPGGCVSLTRTATALVSVNNQPTASTEGNQTICQDGLAIVSGASSSNGTILWTHNGSGSLYDATTLTPNYIATASDAGNTVTLTMTVSNSPCTAATAIYSVIVKASPIVSTGDAVSAICQGGTSDPLGGSFGGGATSAVWSDGGSGGSFSNNDGSTPGSTTYTASPTSGSTISLILTSIGGSCGEVFDSKQLTVNPLPAPGEIVPD